jgi:hypothetical protein
MKYLLLLLILSFVSLSIAQGIDSVNVQKDSVIAKEATTTQSTAPTSHESKWYYGGTVGFNFWSDYFYLSLNPLVGYQISPKFSVGGKLMYSYINDQRYEPFELTSHNYGAGIFARFRPIYQIYLHAEFDYASYEDYTLYTPIVGEPYTESERNWVPFLLVGGGFVQRVGSNAAVYVEVLFDVIQDENSPYEDWDPIISIGGGVGF